jgi:flagellar hook-associated protein 1 FlgK
MNDLLTSSTPSHYDTGVTAGQAHNLAPGGSMNLKLRGPNGQVAVDYTYTVGGSTFGDIVTDLNASPLGTYMTFSLDGDGQLVSTPVAGAEAYKLYSVADTTDRGSTGVTLSRFFGIGEAYSANSANNIGVLKAIADDSQRLALGRFDASATPGDPVITVGDGRGAQMLADLQGKQVSFGAVGQLTKMQVTLGQYGAAFLSNAAQAGTTAQTRKADTQALSLAVDEKLSNATGVNLNEELSNLLIYQNAYNASARIVTTAQQMMDTLIGMMR